jgi:hypothetical protein
MSRIFISHSSRDAEISVAVRVWLAENGWDDVFLDTDPERGITAGKRWKEALQKAAYRCELVLALVSSDWLASSWSKAEIDAARLMGKKIIIALVGADKSQIPTDLTDEQWVDLIHDPNGYARLKEGLRQAGLDPRSFVFEHGRRPYPGLAPLQEKDAAIFFGRDAEIVRGLDKLRIMTRNGVDRMFVIVGASGSGKSSFLRAGLWARLKRDDQAWFPLPTIRPERAVISGNFGLAQSLEQVAIEPPFNRALQTLGLPVTRAGIQEVICTERDGFQRILKAIRGAAGRDDLQSETQVCPTIVIALDQGEELFNQQAQPEAKTFIEMLTRAIGDDCGLLVIVALRSESFPLLQLDDTLARLTKEPFALGSMLEGGYQAVIEGPAKLVAPKPLKIDPLLTEALLRDVSKQDALPLLAFALERLYNGYASGGELTLQHYEKLGRMNGVIDSAVSEAFAAGVSKGELPNDRTKQMALAKIAFIPHLVQLNSAGEFVRRVATLDEIPIQALPLIDQFAERRLLIRDRRLVGDREQEVVELAHEALLRAWQAMKEALDEEREFLVWLSRMKVQAEEYFDLPMDKSHVALLEGSALELAEDWYRRKANVIPEVVKKLIKISASLAWPARRHNRIVEAFVKWGVPSIIGLSVLLVFGVALWMGGYTIMKTITMNSRTNICFENENAALVEAIQDLRNGGDRRDVRLGQLVNRNSIVGKRHHCYELQ